MPIRYIISQRKLISKRRKKFLILARSRQTGRILHLKPLPSAIENWPCDISQDGAKDELIYGAVPGMPQLPDGTSL